MPSWDAELYLRFGRERTQAAIDLAARVALDAPRRVIDLGCGPGNSTAVVRARFPQARITGLDKSEEMLASARCDWPDVHWQQGDLATWTADEPYDLVFSNAAIQWVHGHATLIPHLFAQVATGGALAVQTPNHFESALHKRMHQIALYPEWRTRMGGALNALVNETPEHYYDLLAPVATRVEMWITSYIHVMESHTAILDFIRGTGLRPFLEALASEEERARFTALLSDGIRHDYPAQRDGRVLFPFRRLFFIAYK